MRTRVTALVLVAAVAGCAGPPPADDPGAPSPQATPATTSAAVPTTTAPPVAVTWIDDVCAVLLSGESPIDPRPDTPPFEDLAGAKRQGTALIDAVRVPLRRLLDRLDRVGPPPDPGLQTAYADLRRPLDGLIRRLDDAHAGIAAADGFEDLGGATDGLEMLGDEAVDVRTTAILSLRTDPLLRPLTEQADAC